MIEVLTPASESEAASLVRERFESGRKLRLVGGRTQSTYPISQIDELRSTRLSGIVTYNPAELVMTVKTGTPIAEIEAALAERNQFLAFEPVDHRPLLGTTSEPTIGGIFAANVSGPRRFVAGAARDHLLGTQFINGKGEQVRAGGRVMKNVTGLDLVKLVAGSRGALAFLTEVTFRVLPKPKSLRTVMVSEVGDSDACSIMAKAMSLSVEVSGAAHIPAGINIGAGVRIQGPGATLLRIEGNPASVCERARKLAAVCAAYGPVCFVDAEHDADVWRSIRDVVPFADGLDRVVWRVSVAPTVGHRLVEYLRSEIRIEAFYDWQGGLVWMRFPGDAKADFLRAQISRIGGGHATLIRAPADEWKTVSAQQPRSTQIATLEARIKAKFDPAGIFSAPFAVEH